jgi:hypothetical protein
VSRLCSCTNVRCMEVLRASVQQSMGSSISGPMSQQCVWCRGLLNACTFLTWEHAHEGVRVRGRERWQRPMNRMREEPQGGSLYRGMRRRMWGHLGQPPPPRVRVWRGQSTWAADLPSPWVAGPPLIGPPYGGQLGVFPSFFIVLIFNSLN